MGYSEKLGDAQDSTPQLWLRVESRVGEGEPRHDDGKAGFETGVTSPALGRTTGSESDSREVEARPDCSGRTPWPTE